MKLLRFFIVHSLRDMWRNRSRTMFALVCVATGVTAVVALRSLAFMVADELTTNLAEVNRGDIRLYASRDIPDIVEVSSQGNPVFTRDGEQVIRDWANKQGIQMTAARMSGLASVRQVINGQAQIPKPVLTFYIEPDTYPFYSTITLDNPAGESLANAFPNSGGEMGALASVLLPKLGALGTVSGMPVGVMPQSALSLYSTYIAVHPRPLVISRNLTRRSSMGLQMGDYVRLGAPDTLYIVSGVAPSESESILSNPQTALLDYVYLPLSDLPVQGEAALPDQIFLKVPLGRDVAAVDQSLMASLQAHYDTNTDFDKEFNRATVAELETQNAETANVIDKMILVMGLSSLLIGGIGIINTMLVVVSRRTLEIAVLKTLGLKANRITGLFMVEAVLMGLLGSLIGIVVGVVLSYGIKSVGEEAFSLSLVWRLYPEAMLSGLFLGMVMTVLFGFLPTLIAGQVRPAVVLRPNEAQMPAAGLLQTLVTLVVMIVVLGVLVNTIIDGAISVSPVYMIAGAGALVGLFAGVIIANMGMGQPIPDYYVFHLPRRFERLENILAGTAGAVTAWLPVSGWSGLAVRDRGRRAITALERGLRQTMLLYGTLAIGAALASGIVLILSEIWLPAGLGDRKPANEVLGAWARSDVGWVLLWIGLTLGIGLAIRLWSRTLVSLIAMASLGVTLGGLIGYGSGRLLEAALDGTGTWSFLAKMSTGVVLVEGALALLGAVFVGYWLLVWLVGKMPGWLLMGLVSLTLTGLIVIAAYAVSLLGVGALIALVMVALVAWLVIRRHGSGHRERAAEAREARADALPVVLRNTTRGTSMLMVSVAILSGGLLLVDVMGSRFWWGAVLAGAVVVVGLWRYLAHGYGVDARLTLREMAGRRSRVASTLLGLSVGIAGLSLVSLTTGAASQILETQLGDRAEGNLLVVARAPQQRDAIRDVLSQANGVDHFSQFSVYRAVLMEINGESVENPHQASGDEPQIAQNSNMEIPQEGILSLMSMRASLDDLPDYHMVSGRALTPEDAGKPYIMLRDMFIVEELGIKTGDHLTYLFDNGPGEKDDVLMRFTVVGIVERQSEQTAFGDQLLVPPDTLPGTVSPMNIVTIAQVDESDPVYMDDVLISLSNVPGVFAIQLGDLTRLLESLLEQLKAIPTLVAWLALVAGTAIIANTVALATQERRRQIGVMKAVGLKGRRVLGMLVIENGLIGLIAGLIGLTVGLLITVILVLTSQTPDQLRDSLQFATMGWLLLMSIGVAIGAATFSAWSAAAEKPMNVLRYE